MALKHDINRYIKELIAECRYYQVERLNEEYNAFDSKLSTKDKPDWTAGEKAKISMMTVHKDNDELPLFCVKLYGGGFATCYRPLTCECGRELEECIYCGWTVCIVCDIIEGSCRHV